MNQQRFNELKNDPQFSESSIGELEMYIKGAEDGWLLAIEKIQFLVSKHGHLHSQLEKMKNGVEKNDN